PSMAEQERQPPASDYNIHNPHLATVIERNIQTIELMQTRAVTERTRQDRIADVITGFSGRMSFVWVHIVWFSLWGVLNLGWLGITPFDPFPFGLLTMLVSLEAIFLSTF